MSEVDLNKENPELGQQPPTTLDPEKMAEEMAKRQLDFERKEKDRKPKQDLATKEAKIMADSSKARAEMIVTQPEAAKSNPEAPKLTEAAAAKPVETPAAQPASAPAAPAQPAESAPPAEEKGMFGGIWDKIKTFFEDISKKFSSWFGGLFGSKSEEKPADSSSTANSPTSPDKPIEGPDSTAGLSGKQLAEHPQFKARAEQIAKKIHVSLSDLYAIFNIESGIDPTAINKTSGASGLIQWMPKYAPSGTTIDQIRKMTGLQQLEYVDKHFSAQADKIHSFADLYAVVFWPAAVGKPADYVFGAPDMDYAKKVAVQNSGIAKFSQRPDGLIDKAAFDRFANSKRPKDSALVA